MFKKETNPPKYMGKRNKNYFYLIAGILFVGLKKASDDLLIDNKKELVSIVVIYAFYFLLAVGTYLAIRMV